MALLVPVSWGELLDKIAILRIKSERITDNVKRANVIHELERLDELRYGAVTESDELAELEKGLKEVNEALWDIEDDIRICEKDRDFGPRFVGLARSVYKTNDRRAALKYSINMLLGSDLVEEKSYEPYDDNE
ncbi:DUF6165 family protein [Desulfopila sp. IMCC35008]|uniref:DUF6165 family protein n=1 Tax=Desulfopila sp. IMCC35008 TaxID=2653858 RepID=UPI0013D06EF0|nr:DUF6165 family protein [Desulfopila sp. IMCC35008]